MNIDNIKYRTPYSCYINLTSKCNLRCKHCFGDYSSVIDNELTLKEWKKVIDELIKNNVFYVNISGGEPTQSPFFKEFINYLTKKGMHFILTTNGVFSEDIRTFILENQEYLIGIKISLDGPNAESHCFLRLDTELKENSKIFDITLNNVLFFSRNNLPLTISTVLHKKNILKMDEFRELIKKIDPISWFISPIIPVGRGDANRFISEFYEYYDFKFWDNLQRKGSEKRINIHLIDVPIELRKEGIGVYTCPAALNFCEIHSDGQVSPCTLCRVCIPEGSLKFENIKDKNLIDIWEGKPFEKFRNYMDKGCDGCKMLGKCNKCIAQSFRYFGDGKSPTPFCIKSGEKLGLKNLEIYKDKLKNLGMKL